MYYHAIGIIIEACQWLGPYSVSITCSLSVLTDELIFEIAYLRLREYISEKRAHLAQ